jgi:hypothetical protein
VATSTYVASMRCVQPLHEVSGSQTSVIRKLYRVTVSFTVLAAKTPLHMVTRRVMHPEGILIVELGHPAELYGGVYLSDDDFVDCWEQEEKDTADGKRVLVEYGRAGDAFDVATGVLYRTVGLSAFGADGDMISSDVEVVPQRQFTLQEIEMMATVAGLEIVDVFGDSKLEISLEHEDACRMLVCLMPRQP